MIRGFVSIRAGILSLTCLLLAPLGVGALADGLDDWQIRSSGVTNQLTAVTYGNGMFVAAGRGVILRSTNGVTWNKSQTVFPLVDGQPIVFATVAAGDGLFIAADATRGYRVWKSTDGSTWTMVTENLIVPESSAFGDGLFVVGGCPNGGNTAYSFDGNGWTRSFGMTSFDYIKSVAFGNHKFIAGGYPEPMPSPDTHSGLWQSTNGVNWSRITEASVQSVVFGRGKFLVNVYTNGQPIASDIQLSSDVVLVPQRLAAYGGGQFLAKPANGKILSRTVSGEATIHSFPTGLSDITTATNTYWTFGQGTFVGVGAEGVIYQSGRLAPRITSVVLAGPTTLQIQGEMPDAGSVSFESSLDLVNWTPEPAGGPAGGQWQLTKEISAVEPNRFFRMKLSQ